MPANLDYKADGTAAMLSVRETPWHREGVVLQTPPPVAEALALAGLDFVVKVLPLYVRCGDGYRECPGARATVRTDRDEPLAAVGEHYEPLQNDAAFGVLQPLIDGGLATIETAGSLRGGRDVWLLVRFNVGDARVREVFAGEVVPFGLLSNNHAGQRSVVLQETPIRVVCANTLGLALDTAARRRMVSVRHTLGVEQRSVAAVGQLWQGIVERYRLVAEQYRLLKRCYLDVGEFRRLVLDVVSPRLDPRTLAPGAHKVKGEVVEARRERLRQLWLHGAGHRGDGSAWEAYNGAVQSLDHDTGLWRTRGSRAASLMAGGLAARKQQVLDLLVGHARSTVA